MDKRLGVKYDVGLTSRVQKDIHGTKEFKVMETLTKVRKLPGWEVIHIWYP